MNLSRSLLDKVGGVSKEYVGAKIESLEENISFLLTKVKELEDRLDEKEESSQATLDTYPVRSSKIDKVYAYNRRTGEYSEYNGSREASLALNICQSSICHCVSDDHSQQIAYSRETGDCYIISGKPIK